MRVLFAILLVLASPAFAQKKPWEWTDGERIAARTDPARIRARMDAIRPNRDGAESPAAEVRQREASDTITGLHDAELFLPTEILTGFVSSAYAVDDEPAEGFRLDARARAAEAGLPADFLAVFEREAERFISAQTRDHQLRTAMSDGSMDVKRAFAELELLERTELCPLRFALLERMRELYGAKFDRFLYEGIVRGMSRTYFGGAPTADELNRESRGCR